MGQLKQGSKKSAEALMALYPERTFTLEQD